MTHLYALGSVALISLVSFIGVASLSFTRKKLMEVLLLLVSFAVGALFGNAFFHLLPESFELLGDSRLAPLAIAAGMLLFFTLEKFIRWRHCHIVDQESHTHPIATLNTIGDGVHNFIDGMLIAASYTAGIPIGIATTIAVILHEIPTEIGDFGVLLHSGMSVRKALWYNFVSALFAVVGAGAFLLFGSMAQDYAVYLIPFTAGAFIYIAGADLIPELHHDSKPSMAFKQFLAIILGLGVMFALTFME